MWRTDWDGGTALVNDYVLPGEKIALADGSYRAILHFEEAEDSGYRFADAYQPDGWWSTYIIDFNVIYGKPDREIAFYLEDVDHAIRRSLGLTDD